MQYIPDYKKSEQYNLSIRLSPNGFSFYVVDPVNGGAAVYETLLLPQNQLTASSVEELVYRNEQLLLPFKRTEIIVVSPVFSLIPISLLSEEKETESLSFLFPEMKGKCMVNNFRKNELVNQFAMDEAIYNFLTRTLSVTRVTHYITPILEYFIERSKFGNYSKLYVNVESDRLDLFCFNRNQLVLANSFPFQQLNDAIYFILYSWEKLELNQINDELHICGDSGLRSRIVPHIAKYIQRVLPLNPPTSWYVAPADNKPLPLDIKTLSLCV